MVEVRIILQLKSSNAADTAKTLKCGKKSVLDECTVQSRKSLFLQNDFLPTSMFPKSIPEEYNFKEIPDVVRVLPLNGDAPSKWLSKTPSGYLNPEHLCDLNSNSI